MGFPRDLHLDRSLFPLCNEVIASPSQVFALSSLPSSVSLHSAQSFVLLHPITFTLFCALGALFQSLLSSTLVVVFQSVCQSPYHMPGTSPHACKL